MNNPDAISRLKALSAPNALPISMAEHQSRLNDTLVRRRTDAKSRSDRQGARPRRQREEERARVEADRAARIAAGTAPPHRPHQGYQGSGPTPHGQSLPTVPEGPTYQGPPGRVVSPAPKVGEIMSPGIAYAPNAYSSTGSFPRPPIPHHAWSGVSNGSDQSQISTGSGGMRYTLQDPGWGSLPEQERRREEERRRREKDERGPQTFAEMGFVSKPVEDEGCVIA